MENIYTYIHCLPWQSNNSLTTKFTLNILFLQYLSSLRYLSILKSLQMSRIYRYTDTN